MHLISPLRLTAGRNVRGRVVVGQFNVEVGFDIHLGHAVAQVLDAHDGRGDGDAITIEDADAVVGGLHFEQSILCFGVQSADKYHLTVKSK